MSSKTSVSDQIYEYAQDYLRLADPSVRELTVDLSIRSGIDHISRYTGYDFGLRRTTRTILLSDQEIRISEPASRNIRIHDKNHKVLSRYSDGTRLIRLNKEICDCCQRDGSAFLSYESGITCLDEFPVPLLLGLMKYVAFIYENRGDQNQLNLRSLNDALSRSGAFAEWKSYIRKVD